jgi:hypothetical protein
MAEIETGIAEKSSPGTRQKLGLVWRIRKKISQLINAYLHLPFFLLIILWFNVSMMLQETFFASHLLLFSDNRSIVSLQFLVLRHCGQSFTVQILSS